MTDLTPKDLKRSRYKYITDEILVKLDETADDQFTQTFVLINTYGLTKMQSHRAIRYWRAVRQVLGLDDDYEW